MSIPHPLTSSLPPNTEVHVSLRWHRGLLGLPMPAPAIRVANRKSKTLR